MSSLKSRSPTSMLEETPNFQKLPPAVAKLFIPTRLKGMAFKSLSDKIKTNTFAQLSVQDHGCLSSLNQANNSLRGVTTKRLSGKKLHNTSNLSARYNSLKSTSVVAFNSLESGTIANKLNIQSVTQTILSLQLKQRTGSYPAGLDKCAGRKLIEYHSSIAHEHLKKCTRIIVPVLKMQSPKSLQKALTLPKTAPKNAQNLGYKSSKEQNQTQDHALPPLPPTIEVPPRHERSVSMRCSLNNIAQAHKKKVNTSCSVDGEAQGCSMNTQEDSPKQYPGRNHATHSGANEQAITNTLQVQNQMPDSQQQEVDTLQVQSQVPNSHPQEIGQAVVDTPEVQNQMPDSQQREIGQTMVDTPEDLGTSGGDAQNRNLATLASSVQDQTSGTATTQRQVPATGQSTLPQPAARSWPPIPIQIHPSLLQQQIAGSLPFNIQVPVTPHPADGQPCTPVPLPIHPSTLQQLVAGYSGQTHVPGQSCTPIAMQMHPSVLQQLIAGQSSAPITVQIHPSSLLQALFGQTCASAAEQTYLQIHPSVLQQLLKASVPVHGSGCQHLSGLQQLVTGQSCMNVQQPVAQQACAVHPINSSTQGQQENVPCTSHGNTIPPFTSPQSQLISFTHLNNAPQCAVHPTHAHPNHVLNPQATGTRCTLNNPSGHCCHHVNAEALLAQTPHQSTLTAQQPSSLLPSVARMQLLSPFTACPVHTPQISNVISSHSCQQSSASVTMMPTSEEKQCQTDGTGSRSSIRLQEMNACSVPLTRLENQMAEMKDTTNATTQKRQKLKGKGHSRKKSRQY